MKILSSFYGIPQPNQEDLEDMIKQCSMHKNFKEITFEKFHKTFE